MSDGMWVLYHIASQAFFTFHFYYAINNNLTRSGITYHTRQMTVSYPDTLIQTNNSQYTPTCEESWWANAPLQDSHPTWHEMFLFAILPCCWNNPSGSNTTHKIPCMPKQLCSQIWSNLVVPPNRARWKKRQKDFF